MPCSVKWQHIQKQYLDQSLRGLVKAGINPFSTSYLNLARAGNYIDLNLGFKVPRPVTFILKLFGLSPGEIKLWFDAESGWLSEARERPGAPPIYHYITVDQAITLLKGELTHDLEKVLMTPDEYLGE